MNKKQSKLMLAALLGLAVLPSCTSEYDPVKESRSRAFDIVIIRRPVAVAPTPAPAPAPAPVVEAKPAAPVVVKSSPVIVEKPAIPTQPAPQQVAAPLPVVKTTTQAVSVSPRQQAPQKEVSSPVAQVAPVTPVAPVVKPAAPVVELTPLVPAQPAPQQVAAPLPVVRTTTQAASVSPKQESPKKQVTAPTSSSSRQIYVNQYGQQVVAPATKAVVDYPVMPSRTHGGRGTTY